MVKEGEAREVVRKRRVYIAISSSSYNSIIRVRGIIELLTLLREYIWSKPFSFILGVRIK